GADSARGGGWYACGQGAAVVNGILIFAARDADGCEPWRSDGLTAQPLRDINPGPGSSFNPAWQYTQSLFTAAGDLVVFSAYDGAHGLELWATDGTTTTRIVQDIVKRPGWSSPGSFTPVGPTNLFRADRHHQGRGPRGDPGARRRRGAAPPGGTAPPAGRDARAPARRRLKQPGLSQRRPHLPLV